MAEPLNESLEDAIRLLYRAARFGAEILSEHAYGDEPVDVADIEDTLCDINRLRADAEASLSEIGLDKLVDKMQHEAEEGGE
jgi:hypothetical protein